VIFINFKFFEKELFLNKIPLFFSPEKIFLLIGLFFGIVFIILTPPFQVADESTHFWKAYENSEFKNFGTMMNGVNGDFLPASLSYTIYQLKDDIPFHSWKKYDIEKTFSFLNYPLTPDEKSYQPVLGVYAPVAYAPQIIAISLGKLLNWSPLALMYLGRLFNFCAWLFLIYLAIQITPVGKWVFMALALTPMSLFQAASVSQDAFINGIAFLSIGFFLFLILDKNKKVITSRDMLILCVFIVFLSLSKQIYSSIGLLFLLIPLNKFRNTKDFILKLCFLVGLIMIVNISWQYLTRDLLRDVVVGYGYNLEDQIFFITHNPINFSIIFINTLFNNGSLYLTSFIGNLGWLDTVLPDYIYILGFGVLFFISIVDNDDDKQLSLRHKVLFCFIIIASILGIFIAQYLIFNPVGAKIIIGPVGRYFIPISPLLFLLLYNNTMRLSEKQKNYAKLITVLAFIFILLVTTQTIFMRYYSNPLPLWVIVGTLSGIVCSSIFLFNFLLTKKGEEVKNMVDKNSKKESLMIIFLILLILSLIIVILLCTGSKLGVSQADFNQPVGEIYGGMNVGQTFYSPLPNMNEIDVILATYARSNSKDVIFHLRDSPYSKIDIETITVNARQIRDNTYHKFKFSPMKDSANKSYYFFIESPDSVPGDAITLWSSNGDSYSAGTEYFNSISVARDLTFNVYYTS
jgi:uncharacterized membrane protein